jgi:hypothetical protein
MPIQAISKKKNLIPSTLKEYIAGGEKKNLSIQQ